MSNDQQPEPRAFGPQPGWGGEYDAEATAFIELPGGYPEGSGGEPLAAPGHGFQPPEIASPAATPVTAEATMDPGATGQWTMPFTSPGGQSAAGAPSAPGAHAGAGDAFAGGLPAGAAGAGQPPGARAAAMGQGAAAALAGARRPPGGAPPPGRGDDGPRDDAHAPAPWPAQDPAPRPAQDPAPWPAQDPGEPHPAEAGETELAPPVEAVPGGSRSEHPEVAYVLHVNGVERPVSGAWIGESLLYVLRERLGLAGAKDGCSQGECGACSVQVDGRLVAACLVPAATAAGSEIRTVEGLSADGSPSDVQRALAAGAVQCGFCLPGMAMTVHDLLQGNHTPSELETRQALCGNLCRCSGYRGVLDAVRAVVEERSGARSGSGDGQGAEGAGAAGAAAGAGAQDQGDEAGHGGPQERAPRIPHQSGPPAGGM
ncbi:(2Fe-2S)-binding protein [Streptomyces marincola]|uniref:(2Fe-2S)-binding protein n=1 Tax=Streptomyces marincola TaxID=2878388 RepID=UPI001CF0DD01|nr:(2Fe-2S)-binding protein [Streptomyces marincola]UCM88337.1 2Fe-2S iron-sulfur cluster binding domain-containing protein [Streptomyces marincola]